MNFRAILVLTLFILSLSVSGQTISFGYDENGNRTSRLLVEPVNNDIANSLIMNPRSLQKFHDEQQSESLKTKDEALTEQIKSESEVIKPTVYPNPTKGLLRVVVPNIPMDAVTVLRVYDLNGNELKTINNCAAETEIDISEFQDGIYILRMKINQLIFSWKVIKRN